MTTTAVSKRGSMAAVFAWIFGATALAMSLWAAFLVGALGGDTAVVLLHAGDYRPAMFTIEKLVFVPGAGTAGRASGTRSSGTDRYWAEGRIGDAAEKFTYLGTYVQGVPKSKEEFERQLSVGRQLPVLYNPDLSLSSEMRVLYPKEHFHEYWQQRWKNIFLAGYLPMGTALVLCIFCSFIAKSWSALKMALCSVPIALAGWVPAVLKTLRG